MRRIVICLIFMMLFSAAWAEEYDLSIWDSIVLDPENAIEADTALPDPEEPAATPDNTAAAEKMSAREDLIERIIAMGYDLYVKADGKAQRAREKGDIYLCKNFTTHIFNSLRDDFCMQEYPDVKLRVPNNLPEEDCKPYYYGLAWENVSAQKGNPFYEAASFRYNTKQTKEENMELACEFMRQAQRGDYFQMSAKYEYGTGAHSAIMMGYDAEKDEIHWMDSNMPGYSKNGIRYGYCQYDEVRSVEWWASTFCLKGRGATLYRLRDDIAYRED